MMKYIISAAMAAMLLAVGCDKPATVTDTPPKPPKPPHIQGRVHHIVFVIDRSGSMVDNFDQLRQEMRMSISLLDEDQSFHMIFFGDDQPIENEPRRLVPANDDNKIKCVKWLDDVRPSGQTDPIPALKRAFEVLSSADSGKKGKLIYLLTDGVFPDNEKVIELIRSENKDKEVQIYTFLYGSYEEEAEEVLKTIAHENGGLFKRVDPDDE